MADYIGYLFWSFSNAPFVITVKKRRTVGPSNSIGIIEINNSDTYDLDQNHEYENPDEDQAQMGGTIVNPSYGESVDSAQSAAKPRPGGDYEEMKEGSAANECHFQQLDSKRNPDYERLNPSNRLDTAF